MLKFMVTAILILCMSAFASSNECMQHPRHSTKHLDVSENENREKTEEFSTFPLIRNLYL